MNMCITYKSHTTVYPWRFDSYMLLTLEEVKLLLDIPCSENVRIICRKYFKISLNGSEVLTTQERLCLAKKHELPTVFL